MIVVIAMASSSGQLSGVQRHAISLGLCLLTREEIREVHLIASPWQREFVEAALGTSDARLQLHSAAIGNNFLSRNLWFYRQLPRIAAQLKADVVHLAYPAPASRRAFRCPLVVTLHDLYPFDIPENFGFPKVLFNRSVLRQCLRAADAVACVSQSTLSRLNDEQLRLAHHHAVVVYNAVEPHAAATCIPASLATWRDEPFMLCIAQHRRNKNILLALQVLDRMARSGSCSASKSTPRMAIVGIPGPETQAIESYIAASGLEEHVALLHGLSEAELKWCYTHAALLLAPSAVEGFGLPVAEALIAGCPVVCSDLPVFRELGGDHCRYVPLSPHALEGFLTAIRTTLHSARPQPVALPQFSAPVIARQYLQLYQSLLAPSTANPDTERDSSSNGRPATHMNNQPPNGTPRVLGIRVEPLNIDLALARVEEELAAHRKGYVCLIGVHGLMEAHRDPDLARGYARASVAVPDGMPLVWLGRWQGFSKMRRVAGPDLMLEIFRRKQFANYTHFLYGGKEGVAEELRDALQRRFPWARIVGVHTPPFRSLTEDEERSLADRIAELKPDIFWVGIGTPKQERFMMRYLPLLDTTLMFGVGAAFDFHTGHIKDSPEWVKLAGLQWLHRLIQDPRRLLWRYLRNNTSFLWHILLELTGMRTYPPAKAEHGITSRPQAIADR